jgi:hypothetical protein
VHGGRDSLERRRGRFTTLIAEPATRVELRLDRLDARRALRMLAGLVLEAGGCEK